MGCWPCIDVCRDVESRIRGSHYLVASEEEEEEEQTMGQKRCEGAGQQQ